MNRQNCQTSPEKQQQRMSDSPYLITPAILSDGDNNLKSYPELMTESELIEFLRIPETSNAQNYHNVIENLKRVHGLPRVSICGKNVYLKESILEWLKSRITTGN